MERFQNEEKYKRTESEDMPYQHKDKNSKQFKIESSSSSKVYGDPHKRIINILVIVAKIIIIQKREILNLTKRSLENSRKLSHQPLMVKLRREKRMNHGCLG